MKIHRPEYFFDGAQLAVAHALLKGDADAVRNLAVGVPLNTPARRDMTLLFFALQCSFGEKPAQLEALTALVEAGANPLQVTPGMGTPLGAALRARSPDYARAFLRAGVSPAARIGETPIIFLAATHHTEETLKLLLDHGADPNARDGRGAGVLNQVASSMQLDLVDVLLERGADPRITSHLGISFPYQIERLLSRQQTDSPAYIKLSQIRDRLIASGIEWPPLDPPAMREKMRARGMKVIVPAGLER